ncbi:MAG: hypothetical protein ACREMU_07050, partial [Gemmatimonadaceae bacterium]
DLSRRATADRVTIRKEFDVRMTGYKKYVLKGEEFTGDFPLKGVDTFSQIELLLDWPRSEVEERRT